MDHDVERVGVYLRVGREDEAVGLLGEVRPPGPGERGKEGSGRGGRDWDAMVEEEAEGLEGLPGLAGLCVGADEEVEHLRLRGGGRGEEGRDDLASGGPAPARHAEEERLALGGAAAGGGGRRGGSQGGRRGSRADSAEVCGESSGRPVGGCGGRGKAREATGNRH